MKIPTNLFKFSFIALGWIVFILLCYVAFKDEKTNEISERVVWLQKIFPNKINRGYYSGAYIVTKVNGITIKDFNHFVNILDTTKDEYIVIEFVESGKIVLKTKEARDSFKEIKESYGLKSDRRINL